MNTNTKLTTLRQEMKKKGVDTYIITGFDPHLSEYKSDYFNSVQFISGFTGSNGTVVVTNTEAGLWTDGRYFIQADIELDNEHFTLFKMNYKNTPTFTDYALTSTPMNGTIAIDGRSVSKSTIEKIQKGLLLKNLNLISDIDLISSFWKNRRPLSNNPVFKHDLNFSGKTIKDKIEKIRQVLKNENCHMTVINVLEDISWIFNLRGSDSSTTPIFNSYAIVSEDESILFIDSSKILHVSSFLKENNVIIKNYDEIYPYLDTLENKNIYVKPTIINYLLYCKCNNQSKKLNVVEGKSNISELLKSVKNEVEIENIKKSTIRDCVALVKAIKEIKTLAPTETICEFDITAILTKYRKLEKNYLSPSFDTIAGYNENGAMLHYSAKETGSSTIKSNGFLLIDSGGQYLDGTTDITRTISLGNLTSEMKKDFTLVLKSLINVSTSQFLNGTPGAKIDMLGRIPMWDVGLDYKCGTGHGLGYVLNVHEGPCGIGGTLNKIYIGNLLTNEPGVYKEGKYGIRTENTMIVEKSLSSNGDTFCRFNTVTYFPFDVDAIDTSLLTTKEINWINKYHKKTFNTLKEFLNDEEVEWLKNETKEIY